MGPEQMLKQSGSKTGALSSSLCTPPPIHWGLYFLPLPPATYRGRKEEGGEERWKVVLFL